MYSSDRIMLASGRSRMHNGRMTEAKLSAHDARRVAVEAACDPRTVRSFVAGRLVKGTSRARIADALARLGLTQTVPPTPADGAGLPRPEAGK